MIWLYLSFELTEVAPEHKYPDRINAEICLKQCLPSLKDFIISDTE